MTDQRIKDRAASNRQRALDGIAGFSRNGARRASPRLIEPGSELEKALVTAYLAPDSPSIRALAERFGLDKSTVHRTLHRAKPCD